MFLCTLIKVLSSEVSKSSFKLTVIQNFLYIYSTCFKYYNSALIMH